MIMNKASLLAAGALIVATGIMSPRPANATVLGVTVWTGDPTSHFISSQNADLANKPTSIADATFQYTTVGGLTLNFNDTSPQNTTTAGGLFSSFFATDPGSISSFLSPNGTYTNGNTSGFMGTSMSIAGNAYTT